MYQMNEQTATYEPHASNGQVIPTLPPRFAPRCNAMTPRHATRSTSQDCERQASSHSPHTNTCCNPISSPDG
ncbi:hypothetical protein BGZ60DRAFT_393094 [Tricladium varicosporioides]|nr:hypothetical protein BGZ60DRAFT_393094 [Hymenoscyphus varicosporioides]